MFLGEVHFDLRGRACGYCRGRFGRQSQMAEDLLNHCFLRYKANNFHYLAAAGAFDLRFWSVGIQIAGKGLPAGCCGRGGFLACTYDFDEVGERGETSQTRLGKGIFSASKTSAAVFGVSFRRKN